MNGSSLDGGVEFIKGDKGFWKRYAYLDVENLGKGHIFWFKMQILIQIPISMNQNLI